MFSDAPVSEPSGRARSAAASAAAAAPAEPMSPPDAMAAAIGYEAADPSVVAAIWHEAIAGDPARKPRR